MTLFINTQDHSTERMTNKKVELKDCFQNNFTTTEISGIFSNFKAPSYLTNEIRLRNARADVSSKRI